MKSNVLLIALSLMTFLCACQNNGQKPGPLAANNSTVKGPNDSGGGDTCNGKMIESYKVDITELEEYKEFLQPIIDKTAPEDERTDGKKSDSPFLFAPKMKTWYLIDCKLQEIPNERKGLYLETYQTAIHTSREIFIDADSYKSMVKEEKAKLLLHEMVMAYYMIKFISIDDLCKLSGTCNGDLKIVGKWKMLRPEKYHPLNEQDHQNIRSVTAWLWSKRDSLTSDNFLDVLKKNDFDKRMGQSDNDKKKEIELDPQVLIRTFKRHQWSQSFPKFCQFTADTLISQSTCKVSVEADIRDLKYAENFTIKQLYVKMRITRDSDKKIIEQEFSYPLLNSNQKLEFQISKLGSVVQSALFSLNANWPSFPGVTPTEGMRSNMLILAMNFSDQENPEIYQMIYQTSVWYSFQEELVEKDGIKFKYTYGYSNLLEDESEIIFAENELPFLLNFKSNPKTYIKSVQIP